METGIEKHKEELESLVKKLNETVETKKKELKNLIFNDKFLELLSECQTSEELEVTELELLKQDFKSLAKDVDPSKMDALLKKPDFVFPGMGDIKEKPDDPFGDYVIFHEMMKYMKNNKTNAILLTFDNSKGDWMNKSKSPHLHYTQNVFANTGQILYILDAERTLGDLLNVNIESLVTAEPATSVRINSRARRITYRGLLDLVSNMELFKNYDLTSLPHSLVAELKINGYNFISEVEEDVNKAQNAFLAFQNVEDPDKTRFKLSGIFRVCLKLANPYYSKVITGKGQTITFPENVENALKKYTYLIN